jgi:hypothetical protein
MRTAISTDLLLRLMSATEEQYAAVERVLRAKSEILKAETLKPESPVRPGHPQKIIHTIGRLEYREGFKDVWVDDVAFNLRPHTKARLCLEYLVASLAFDANSARHFRDEIDPHVRETGDFIQLKEIKIQDYFREPTGQLIRLCQALIRSAGNNGKYYLQTDGVQVVSFPFIPLDGF